MLKVLTIVKRADGGNGFRTASATVSGMPASPRAEANERRKSCHVQLARASPSRLVASVIAALMSVNGPGSG